MSSPLVSSGRDRLWPTAVAFVAFALAATLRNRPTHWIGDNRFELYANPARRIEQTLRIWDSSRGLGRIREEFWPFVTIGIGAFRAVGFSEALTQHLWHATLISIGGIGVVWFMRLWHRVIGIAHWWAGLVWMFGPFSVAFLLPSNLYLSYAAAPWIIGLSVRAVRQPTRWTAPAIIALILAGIGNVDYAGLMFVVIFAALAACIDQTVSARPFRSIVSALWRTALLAIPANAAALYKTLLAAEVFEQRVRDTETPTVISIASSWSESLRGLGSWLLYISDRSGPTRPQTAVYFSDDLVILATFAIPILAVVGLVVGGKNRSVLGGLFICAAVLMVGNYPIDSEAPFGHLIAWARDNVPQLGGLRNGFKAGSGLMLGIACLSGIAVDWMYQKIPPLAPSRQQIVRYPLALLGLAVVGLISQPFWRGPLYNPAWELEAVPDYVGEFADWVNERESDHHRALVIPGSTRNGFRWGWVNDDYLDAMLDQPHVTNTAIELSRPIAADILQSYDASLGVRPDAGLSVQIARRIGADLIVIRNDHRWEVWGQPRPVDLQSIRNDPDLTRIATFGEPGENTSSAFDATIEADFARLIPPIEVYAVQSPRQFVDLRDLDQLIVSGAGNAYVAMNQLDLLGDASIRYSADLRPDELRDELASGAPLIITDTNRRREIAVTLDRSTSWTLGADERFDRPIVDLFERSGSQTTVAFGAASTVRSVSVAEDSEATLRFQRAARPGLAFDGLTSTAWLTGVGQNGVREKLRVDFERTETLTGMSLQAALASNGPTVLEADIVLSDGTIVAASFDTSGTAQFDLEPRRVDWFEIILTQLSGNPSGIAGIAEINADGLSQPIRESHVVPSDIALVAASDPHLAEVLSLTPTAWVFSSDDLGDRNRTQGRMARTFTTFGELRVTARGEFTLGSDSSDELLGSLLGGELKPRSTSRAGSGVQGWAGWAFDRNPTTAWLGVPAAGETLTLSMPERPITSVSVVVDQGPTSSPVTALELLIGDDPNPVARRAVTMPADCVDPQDCYRTVRFELDEPALASSISLRVAAVETRGIAGRLELPVTVVDVQIDRTWIDIFGLARPARKCDSQLFTIDAQPVLGRLTNDPLSLFTGLSGDFETCDDTRLGIGSHDLIAEPGISIDAMVLGATSIVERKSTSQLATAIDAPAVTENGSAGWTIEVPSGLSGYVTIGQSFDPRWKASLNGQHLAEPISIDGQTAWLLTGTGGTLDVTFPPQRRLYLTLALSLISWVACVTVVAASTRRKEGP